MRRARFLQCFRRSLASTSLQSQQRVLDWASAFGGADTNEVKDLFVESGFWRDMVAFSWNIRTFEGSDEIAEAFAATTEVAKPRNWQVLSTPTGAVEDASGGAEAWLSFETSAGTGKAHVRLDANNRARTLLTTLQELHGHPFRTGRNRAVGAEHGVVPNRRYWHEKAMETPQQPYVVIIGAGQAGLALGARLTLLGVPYLIVESQPTAGASWRARYPSLCLHDPVWYDHMPYVPFPSSWPIFTPRDKMASFLESYADIMDLSMWTNATVTSAVPPYSIAEKAGIHSAANDEHDAHDAAHDDDTHDDAQVCDRWRVTIRRRVIPSSINPDGSAVDHDEQQECITLRPTHVVFATGNSGQPRVPTIRGADEFRGQQLHSSDYDGGKPFAGRHCVVLGCNTSAHDIVQDLWEQGAASATMVQRSAGLVVSTQSLLEHALEHSYSETMLERGIDHEAADLISTTVPYRMAEAKWRSLTEEMKKTDAELHARLRAVGFRLDFGEDGTGVYGKSFRRGGGFYIDVGASELIASGRVGLASGGVSHLESDRVVLESGETLRCDALIYATGFDSLHEFVSRIVSEEAARCVGRTWGLGSGATAHDPGPWEGELRNMWKPTALDGLWFMGGNLAQCRHYSRFLALQLQARFLGLDCPVHGKFPAVPYESQAARGDKI